MIYGGLTLSGWRDVTTVDSFSCYRQNLLTLIQLIVQVLFFLIIFIFYYIYFGKVCAIFLLARAYYSYLLDLSRGFSFPENRLIIIDLVKYLCIYYLSVSPNIWNKVESSRNTLHIQYIICNRNSCLIIHVDDRKCPWITLEHIFFNLM